MIDINGKNYTGKSIMIANNNIIIDGKDCTPDSTEINLTINGNVNEIHVDVCNKIQIKGDCGNVKTKSGSIEINGAVKGSVKTMSGNINCADVSGNASTMSGKIKQFN